MVIWTAFREEEPQHDQLQALVWDAFRAPLTAAEPMPDAALSYVYRVSLPREPHQAIVKWQHHLGRSSAEARQLEELRKYGVVRVPEVYLCDPDREVLAIEYLPGVRADSVEPPDAAAAEQLADDVVSALLAWHGVKNPAGFGPLDGPYYGRWADYYIERLVDYHAEIHSETSNELMLTDDVLEVADRSLDRAEEILGHAHGEASLVHSDYHLANLLMDPKTLRLTGAIDPLDAEWADPELDLIHLEWPWGDKQHFLTRYQQRVALPENFPLRFAFYRFWYAMQNLARLPWHDPQEDHRLAEALDQAMSNLL
ncbi:MAG: phosphotransferase [Gemmatimonadota bacterium]|nr:MAG: phosphotransferase [Gemmatimonadota bacterium]